jgi:hypothetical protein
MSIWCDDAADDEDDVDAAWRVDRTGRIAAERVCVRVCVRVLMWSSITFLFSPTISKISLTPAAITTTQYNAPPPAPCGPQSTSPVYRNAFSTSNTRSMQTGSSSTIRAEISVQIKVRVSGGGDRSGVEAAEPGDGEEDDDDEGGLGSSSESDV